MDPIVNIVTMETIVKKIVLYIPDTETMPPGFATLSPEETWLILNGGYNTFMSLKNGLLSISHEEIGASIRSEIAAVYEQGNEDLRGRLDRALMDLQVLQELHKTYTMSEDEKIDKQVARRLAIQQDNFALQVQMHQAERDQMMARILSLEKELVEQRNVGKQMDAQIRGEALSLVQRDLDSMQLMLREKDKQNDSYKTLLEKAAEKLNGFSQKKDVVSLGKIGEQQFGELALQAFRDFEAFEMIDIHSIGGQGDFHLKFKDFTVLADSKKYTNKVNSTSRDKIKRDLKTKEHIHIAWLVSLNTTIDKFDKAPFMFEWLTGNKCICYINSLMLASEPVEMLRAVFYACQTIYHIMNHDESRGDADLHILREQQLKVKEIAQKMQKNNRERETIMTQFRNNFDRSDEYIRELLNEETNKMVMETIVSGGGGKNDHFSQVAQWWKSNMEKCDGDVVIKSTALWTQFKRDCEVGTMTRDQFKDILISFLPEAEVVKPKSKAGALEIMGYKLKEIDVPDIHIEMNL